MFAEEDGNKEFVQTFLHAQGLSFDTTKQGITFLASHVRQRETWDCGIACLQMILDDDNDEENEEGESSYQAILDAIGSHTQSIWTADLVWYLNHHLTINDNKKKNKYSCWFVTKSLCPNPEWEQLKYYQQAYSEDCQRVTQRIDDMQQQQQSLHDHPTVSLQQVTESLPLAVVIELIQREDCIAMALVDHTLLLLEEHTHNTQSLEQEQQHYVGHYILLTGILQEENDPEIRLVVHNPAVDKAPTYVSLKTFERAWRAQGTDEDIVFVFFHTTTNTG